MPFDLNTAVPIDEKGFDLSTASPVDKPAPKPVAPKPPQAPAASTSFLDRLGRDVEPWITAGTGALALPISGLAGLAAGGDADVVRSTQQALTYQPRSAGGQEGLAALGGVVGKIGDVLTTPVQTGLGDANLISRYIADSGALADAGHPGLATLHDMIPQALGLMSTGGATGALESVAKGLPSTLAKAPGATVRAADSMADMLRSRFGKSDIPVRPTADDFPPIPASARSPIVAPPAPVPVAPKPLDPTKPALFQMEPTAPSYVSQPDIPTRPLDPNRPALFQNTSAPVVAAVEPEIAPTATAFAAAPDAPVTAADRMARADTLKAIGLNPEQHPSAITGDKKLAGQEWQEGKLLGPDGDARKSIVDLEQSALRDNGDTLIAGTGGTPGISPDTRGQNIVAPMAGLRNYFDTQIKSAYTDARAVAGDLPAVTPDQFHAKLNDPDFRATLMTSQDGTSLLKQIDGQAARFGLLNGDGVPAPATVNQAEQMRQWLNSPGVYKPSNGAQLGALKDAIDLDVAKVGGDDTFKFARDLHGIKKDTLDNPDGISKILTEEGPDGINRRVPFEKVPAKIVEMPNAQFGHIIDTLKNVPDELQPQAQQAINEIRAQMMERMVGAGTMNGQANVSYRANAFTKAMNDLQDKLPMVFSNDEIAAIRTQNDAGHILHRDKSYPGAEIQKQNLAVRGMKAALPTVIGGAAGAVVGGPMGTGIGAGLGGMATGFVNNAAAKAKAAAILRGVPLDQLVGK